jgi:hypothetical protein
LSCKKNQKRKTEAPPLKSCSSAHKKLTTNPKSGRPQGTYKRYLFEETRLGFFLKYEVPVVYDVIMKMTPPAAFLEPSPLLVKTVCKSSRDPSLKKSKFRRYLKEYAGCGLYCKRPKRLTPERERYYERIRKRKIEEYIGENRERIEKMRT